MKPNKPVRTTARASAGRAAAKARAVSNSHCRELAVQMANIKNGLVREFGTALGGHGRLLHSALNEAEALAWQTPYPHLIFPILAHEKAAAVNCWAARQRRVHRASREIAMAV